MNTIRKIPATKQDVETAIEKAVDRMADMIGKGFAHNDTRFDAIDSRMDSVESRLGKIENLLMEEHKRKLENLEARMKRLEDALAV